MIDLSLDLKEDTQEKLKKILLQYPDKELFAKSIIEYEISELRRANIDLKIDLMNFEKKYNLSSSDFLSKIKSGEVGDEEEFIIWAGLLKLQAQNQKRLAELE